MLLPSYVMSVSGPGNDNNRLVPYDIDMGKLWLYLPTTVWVDDYLATPLASEIHSIFRNSAPNITTI